jgi:ElaB/YqjD/DUF883 family membrane-anchored ribosome-binding protein
MNTTTSTSNVQEAVKNAAYAARERDLEGMKENAGLAARETAKAVEEKLGRARRAASMAAERVETSAREHPWAAAGILVGAGMLAGAALHRALRPTPTAGQVLMRAFEQGASSTGDAIMTGLKRMQRALR